MVGILHSVDALQPGFWSVVDANDAGLQRKLALELQQANQPHAVEGLEQQQRQQLRIVRQQVAELRAELGHD